ncbi:MAG: hypothetical protein JO078_12090 [Candidatus Eremiobacteraeota bacterium]|nr:hypothetical protein [Candidatus Eremiobacteraeota bacterium]
MTRLLLIAPIAVLVGCAGGAASGVAPSNPAVRTATAIHPASTSCYNRRRFVKERTMFKHGIIELKTYDPTAYYTTMVVWNHLRDQSVTVWPENDSAEAMTVPAGLRAPMRRTITTPNRHLLVQQENTTRDLGPGVEVNGMVCTQ